MLAPERSAWLNELARFLRLRSLFLLHGNIYDQYLYPKDDDGYRTAPSLRSLLGLFLEDEGFESVLAFDVIDGFEAIRGSFEDIAMLSETSGRLPTALDAALHATRQLLDNRARSIAVVLDFASRLSARPNELTTEESKTMLRLFKSVLETHVFHDRDGLRNILVCVCEKQNDLPPWLFLDNPLTKGIAVPKPDRRDRAFFFASQRDRFFTPDGGSVPRDEAIVERFVDLTDSMTYRELDNLRAISRRERIPVTELRKILDLYRFGVRHSLWEDLGRRKTMHLSEALQRRVKGQDLAVSRAVQIVKRASLGMTGISRAGTNNRPRGVMFFAGPTGVGKTELAKALAEHIFGDESALVRFDMSEYAHEHSDEKLLGSPPGYVGHDEGGQLTNRISSRPFSIILFDEIEKAHPKLFDKFLQILDDGRITDGKGETVYFSETVIIFTSNLGMYTLDPETGQRRQNVLYNMKYEEIRARLLEEIRRFFTEQLGRPEILNRFGENFVVFDFIRSEVAREIMDHVLDTMIDNMDRTLGLTVTVSVSARDHLFSNHVAHHLEAGGRGVHNTVEEVLVNPLSTYLVDHEVVAPAQVEVDASSGELRFHAAR